MRPPVKITADVVETGLAQVNASCAALSQDHAAMLDAYDLLHNDLVALLAELDKLTALIANGRLRVSVGIGQ